jgi:hypothetical protein
VAGEAVGIQGMFSWWLFTLQLVGGDAFLSSLDNLLLLLFGGTGV